MAGLERACVSWGVELRHDSDSPQPGELDNVGHVLLAVHGPRRVPGALFAGTDCDNLQYDIYNCDNLHYDIYNGFYNYNNLQYDSCRTSTIVTIYNMRSTIVTIYTMTSTILPICCTSPLLIYL